MRAHPQYGMGAGVAMLAGAVWLGVIAYALDLGVGAGPVPLIPLAAAALLAAGGVRRLIRLSALPDRATFDGQVIARWEHEIDSESGSSKNAEGYISVDDGSADGRSRETRHTTGSRSATWCASR